MKKKIWIHPFIIIMLLLIINNCKKDKPSVKTDPVITWSNPADISYGILLSEKQLNATADVAGKFAYTPAFGTNLNVGASQNLKVDFTPTDEVHYNIASKTVKINVYGKKDPIITWYNPANITFNTKLSSVQLNATADIAGTFVYTPGIGFIFSEGMNQDLKVDFTPTDIATYNTASKTVKINVISAPILFNKNKTYGTISDIEGNVYKTIVIGTQTWMAENLKTTKYKDGTPISIETNSASWATLTTGAYCYYNNDTNKRNTYGKLYNFYTIIDSHKLCPIGWHVSTDDEWTTLLNNFTPWPAGSLIEIGTNHWVVPNIWNDNSSGFTALPGGFRNSEGTFRDNLGTGYWWCPTETGYTYARYLSDDSHYAGYLNYENKNTGFSVRCVKD